MLSPGTPVSDAGSSRIVGAVGGAVNVANRLSALVQPTLPPSGLGYGSSDFDRRMANLAWLLGCNLGMRVACVSYDDGWDFHDSQETRQADNLAGLSTTLAAFQADLEARGLADRVLTLVWSEFGRRVAQNASNGTDHGTAMPLFAIGGGVKGGIYGEHPSLTDLDRNGDLKFATDFRAVYATVI